MRRFSHTIRDALGIHARPAGQLLARIQDAGDRITVSLGTRQADARNLIQMIGLNARCGDTVLITVDGPEEERTSGELERFFQDHL